jgi:hypothetical protein
MQEDPSRFVEALKRTWGKLARKTFEEAGKDELSAEEVRGYVASAIATRLDENRSARDWTALPDEVRRQKLEEAFPDGTYRLPVDG